MVSGLKLFIAPLFATSLCLCLRVSGALSVCVCPFSKMMGSIDQEQEHKMMDGWMDGWMISDRNSAHSLLSLLSSLPMYYVLYVRGYVKWHETWIELLLFPRIRYMKKSTSTSGKKESPH